MKSANGDIYAKGIRKIKRPRNVQIGLPPAFNPPTLNVCHADGTVECLKISKRVAEVLLARGFNYEG